MIPYWSGTALEILNALSYDRMEKLVEVARLVILPKIVFICCESELLEYQYQNPAGHITRLNRMVCEALT